MDAKLQRRVQRYGWDKAADHYEQFWHRQLQPAHQRLLDRAAIQQGARVLDVACGTGLVTFPAAALAGPSGAIVAADISDAMVTHITAEAARRGLSNVTAARMDAESLDLPDASFDVVLCALGLMYLPDPVAALREMRRVLRPDGAAIAATWGARNKCGWAEVFSIIDARVQSDVCPMFFRLGSGDELERAFGAAGFKEMSGERLASVLHYDSDEEACGAAFAGGPAALAYSRFDATTRAGAHADYLATIAPWRTGRGYDVPGEFVVVRGT